MIAVADVSAPFLAEDVEPEYRIGRGNAQIVPWELREGTLLVRSGGAAFDQERPGAWRTDGTPEGTVVVPLPGGEKIRKVLALTADRSRLFYLADDGSVDEVLYVTDGTPQGTTRILEIERYFVDSLYHPAADRLLLVQAEEDPRGFQTEALYSTDGTPKGTVRLLPDGEIWSRIDPLAVVGPYGYFLGPAGRLFRTDGTPEGTLELTAFVGDGIKNRGFAAVGNRLVFLGVKHGRQRLWATDGTPEGTAPISDFVDDKISLESVVSGNVGYWNFFGQVIVRSDGTAAGTRTLVELPGITPTDERFGGLLPFGDHSVLFRGFTSQTGSEPWVSDGTVAGTGPLGDICPGPCASRWMPLAGLDDVAYFMADDGTTGLELYGTDGRTISRLADLCPGPCSTEAWVGDDDGKRLAFFADDGDRGAEAYVVQGLDSPIRLSDFSLPTAVPTGDRQFVTTLTETGFYFHAVTLEGPRLVRSDLTPGGLEPLLPGVALFQPVESHPSGFSSFEGDLVFLAYREGESGTDLHLYRKTGDQRSRSLGFLESQNITAFFRGPAHATRATRDTVFALVQDPAEALPRFSALYAAPDGRPGVVRLAQGLRFSDGWVAADRLFFIHWEEDSGTYELWVSDGTIGGTRVLRSQVGSGVATPFSGRLLYEEHGGLYLTDGTAAGTELWLDLASRGLSGVAHLEPHGDGLYFTAHRTGTEGLELYHTDGTPEATRRVSTAGQQVGAVAGLVGRRLIYDVDSFPSGLWSAGFTESETIFLTHASLPVNLKSAVVAGHLWFGEQFGDLVRTDGTPEGTETYNDGDHLVNHWEVYGIPGHALIYSQPFLYVTDGTPGLPRQLARLPEFGGPVEPGNGLAYFSADGPDEYDGGHELWAVRVDGAVPPPPPPPRDALATPGNVRAEGRDGGVRLGWTDESAEETRYVVQAQDWTVGAGFETVAELDVDAEATFLERRDLPGGEALGGSRPVRLRVRAENGSAVSPWSEIVSASPVTTEIAVCAVPESEVLCLRNKRFAVEVFWRSTENGTDGRGTAAPFDVSEDSGTFWFFNENNVELVVKVLDARVINGSFWTFFGALSNVEYWAVVTDREAATNVTYYNPPGEICGQAHIDSFPRPEAFRIPMSRALDLGSTGSCTPDGDTLCLTPDRYRITVNWRDPRSGDSGVGRAIPGTSDSGYFWFFDPANVELVIKVLDARVVNGHVWVFYGALTDVEYTITVTDTETGVSKEYTNPAGNICGNADVTAFD